MSRAGISYATDAGRVSCASCLLRLRNTHPIAPRCAWRVPGSRSSPNAGPATLLQHLRINAFTISPCDACGLYLLTMLSGRDNQKTHLSLWVALGYLCCALIFCAAMVQVTHTHVEGQAPATDCALCHTAHVVVQPSIQHTLPALQCVVTALSVTPQPIRRKHFSIFSLFTRPPPVVLAFA